MVTRRQVVSGLFGGTAVGALGVTALSLGGGGNDGRVTALVAGSLLGVAEAVGDATVEAHGSAAVRQLVRDGAREPDAVAVADPRLLAGIAETGRLFATNELALAYDPGSAYAGWLRSDWTTALTAADIRIGRTDPAVDPLGYRTVMALRLADESGVDGQAVLNRSSIHPETEITNLVDGGSLDCAFVYESMAVERGLPAVDLPPELDCSDPDMADRYDSVAVEVDGERLPGTPIRYAATALTERGTDWVERLVTGHSRLKQRGFSVPAEYPQRRPVA